MGTDIFLSGKFPNFLMEIFEPYCDILSNITQKEVCDSSDLFPYFHLIQLMRLLQPISTKEVQNYVTNSILLLLDFFLCSKQDVYIIDSENWVKIRQILSSVI